MTMQIREFQMADTDKVIDLWQRCGLTKPWNDPLLDLERKRQVDPDLFLIGTIDDKLVAVAMGGYEGHRGVVNYLAVEPDLQGGGYGKQLMVYLEKKLTARGCPKINLLIRSSNTEVIKFYAAIGYKQDQVVCMGKRLIEDGE